MAVDWKARLEAAKAAKAAAEAAFTEDDRAEAAARAEEETILAAARKLAAEKLEIDLARREDAARETLGPKVPVRRLVFEDLGHSMIVRAPSAKAHATWEKQIAESANNTKIDRAEVTRNYALACVHDLDGQTDLHGLASKHGGELLAFVREYPAVATSIANLAAELGGLVLAERKR